MGQGHFRCPEKQFAIFCLYPTTNLLLLGNPRGWNSTIYIYSATLGPSWNFSLAEILANPSLQDGPLSGVIIFLIQPPTQPPGHPVLKLLNWYISAAPHWIFPYFWTCTKGTKPKLKVALNEDNLRWKMTSNLRWPPRDDNLKGKTTSNGRQPALKYDLQRKTDDL